MNDQGLFDRDLHRLRKAIVLKPEALAGHPTLIILVGLPGSGKSYFAARLIEKVPAVILESDFLRKSLVKRPVYSQFESLRLFKVIHQLIKELLTAGYNVVLDATNISEDSRRPLLAIAGDTGVRVIVVHMNTPREVAEKRLYGRLFRPDGYSDADWAVYQKLEPGFEPITRPHYEITGAMDISPVIAKIVLEITQNT